MIIDTRLRIGRQLSSNKVIFVSDYPVFEKPGVSDKRTASEANNSFVPRTSHVQNDNWTRAIASKLRQI